MKFPIDYSEGFNDMSPEVKANVCNGAGAANGVRAPNSMWGLDVKLAFDVHDFDYWQGATDLDKWLADIKMLTNCLVIICNKRGFLMYARGLRAMTYFMAVAIFGKKAFYAEKERR